MPSIASWIPSFIVCRTHTSLDVGHLLHWTPLTASRAQTHYSPPACSPTFVALHLWVIQVGLTPLHFIGHSPGQHYFPHCHCHSTCQVSHRLHLFHHLPRPDSTPDIHSLCLSFTLCRSIKFVRTSYYCFLYFNLFVGPHTNSGLWALQPYVTIFLFIFV